jgi:hypothetical protein
MNFGTQKEISTHIIDATNCIKMCDATIEEEELAHILSYQTLYADKIGLIIKLKQSSLKKWSHVC